MTGLSEADFEATAAEDPQESLSKHEDHKKEEESLVADHVKDDEEPCQVHTPFLPHTRCYCSHFMGPALYLN